MKIGFFIIRTNHYRQLAAVVQAAIDRGHEIYLYHLYAGDRFADGKGLQFPVLGQSPFQGGAIHLRIVWSQDRLPVQAELDGVDAMVGLTPRIAPTAWSARVPWVMVQTAIDTFTAPHCGDHFQKDHSVLRSNRWAEMYEAHSGDRIPRRDRTLQAATPGLFEARGLSRQELLRKFDLPDERYLTYLPIPAGIAGYLCGRAPRLWANFVFMGSRGSIVRRGMGGLLGRLLGQLGLPDVTEEALFFRILALAETLNCGLLVKGRIGKEALPDYYRAHSTLVYDETYWPATVHELLRLSDCAVSFRSMAQFEATFLDCFMLNLMLPGEESSDEFKIFQDYADAAYDHPGVSSLIALRDFMTVPLPEIASRLKFDSYVRDEFVRDWDTNDATSSAAEIVDWIEGVVKGSGVVPALR